MLGISRASSSFELGSDWLGEALLNLSYMRAGLRRRRSLDELPDALRREMGLPTSEEQAANPRNFRR
jgi:hypothetical protein